MINTATTANKILDAEINSLAALNDRPTPETDALSKKQYIRMAASANDVSDLLSGALKETEDHARNLERERDEARRQCLQWLEEWHLTDRVRCDMKSERDEAREIAQQLIHTATAANETLDPEHEQEDDETQYLRSLAGSATICINKDDSAGGHFELFPQYEN